MNWIEEHWLRLLFMAGYLALLAYHCWTAKRETHGLGDYLIGGRKLGGWVIALSFYATFVSTNSFVGHAGKSWDTGLIWYIKGVVIVLCCYMAWYLVAPRFFSKALEYKSLTVPDFLGHRYDSLALRRISAIVIFMAAVVYLVAVYKGSALALQQFLGLNYQVAAVTIFLVVTAYTLAGGFRSVVLTDSVQGLLMAVGAVALIVAVLYKGGGITAILENLHAQDPDLVSWQGKMPIMVIFGLALAGGMKMLVDPRQISRIYGLKDQKALGVARIVAPLLILITYLCLLPIGAFAHALIPKGAINDSDLVTPYLLGTAEVLGPTLSSLFLLVLLSAAMSSLDSVLLVAASSVGRDIMIIGDKDPRVLTRTRVWVVVISLLGMLLALNPFGDIVGITGFSGSLYAACFLPTLVFGLYWKGGTAIGALSCVLLGSTTVTAWHFAKLAGWTTWHEVYVGFGVAILAYVFVSLMTSKPSHPVPEIQRTRISATT
ncbi:sodium/solute symporter [Acidobacteria bacterium AH-259-L09]|nr:sodium/solute symporter [Acidobacteria bacterium AH-259-L09]